LKVRGVQQSVTNSGKAGKLFNVRGPATA